MGDSGCGELAVSFRVVGVCRGYWEHRGFKMSFYPLKLKSRLRDFFNNP